MDQPIQTELDMLYVMPWHFKPENEEYGMDCILLATMQGDEMQTISLHAVHLPDVSPAVT